MLGTLMKGDVTPDLESGQRVFSGYGDDYFKLGQEKICSHFYFHTGKVVQDWGGDGIASLKISDFKWLEEKTPEVLVIGTGRRTQFPTEEVHAYLASLKVGFECMDSRSAASTFNILLAEGRNISAAMFLPAFRG